MELAFTNQPYAHRIITLLAGYPRAHMYQPIWEDTQYIEGWALNVGTCWYVLHSATHFYGQHVGSAAWRMQLTFVQLHRCSFMAVDPSLCPHWACCRKTRIRIYHLARPVDYGQAHVVDGSKVGSCRLTRESASVNGELSVRWCKVRYILAICPAIANEPSSSYLNHVCILDITCPQIQY